MVSRPICTRPSRRRDGGPPRERSPRSIVLVGRPARSIALAWGSIANANKHASHRQIFDREYCCQLRKVRIRFALVRHKLSFDGRPHMPKFLRIGVHQSYVSGYTSKAWCVRRVGSAVFLKWGAVEVYGAGDGRKVHWTLPPRVKTVRCGTVQRAKDYAKAAIARRRNHRYESLVGPIAMRRRSAGRSTESEQSLATILFVDIVRSTEKAARLGLSV